MIRNVKFQGKDYLLIGVDDGPIVTREDYEADKISFAVLYPDGNIVRLGRRIGSRADLEFVGDPFEDARSEHYLRPATETREKMVFDFLREATENVRFITVPKDNDRLPTVYYGVYLDRNTRRVVYVGAGLNYYDVLERVHDACGNNPFHLVNLASTTHNDRGAGTAFLASCGLSEAEIRREGQRFLSGDLYKTILNDVESLFKTSKQTAGK